MNLDLIFESLQDTQVKQLSELKQNLLDTGDINRVPVESLIDVIAGFSRTLDLKNQKDLGLALNPNAQIVDAQLAKMLLNVLATIQQREPDYESVIKSACGY